ncbi:hypothetical protein [Sorangium sp. So ce542]|uniref:hypothetical protein n=1 Tax=Sorangium sp. So ce542 TaxID=3133316 RepID=UPI003F633661
MRQAMHCFTKICGVIGISTSIVFAGCMPPEGEEPLGEAAQAFELGLATVVCNSGWPGQRPCYERLGGGREIVPGTITWQIEGHDGTVNPPVIALSGDNRVIEFSVSVHEGNAFNPGKNTTRFTVGWAYK